MKKYFSKPFLKKIKGLVCLSLSLTIVLCVASSNRKPENKQNGNNRKKEIVSDTKICNEFGDTSMVTLAAMHEDKEGKNIALRFYELAATYTIGKEDKNFISAREMLHEAIKNNYPIKIVASAESNTIDKFIKTTAAEIRAYNFADGFNSPKMKITGAEAVAIDLSKIDTSIFDFVDYQKRFPVFRLCTNVVPDYATLVSIFNACASQGCNKPGPYTITNCIPFQYVIDGCYARAHKMRQIIMKQFGYCVEKVFSFSQPYPNTLAVKANMWGGCCVKWWYHVVPLLRMNVQKGRSIGQVCYVLDPGMFTTPVKLSTWLNAQKNTTCDGNAKVTSYSIQAGSAYCPMNGGASFSTDPNYTATEQTLIGYKNGVTCN